MRTHGRRSRATGRSADGFTLVELLVAMVIGLAVTLVVTRLVTVGESHKRATLAMNDVGLGSAYASYILDRAIRSAGSGLVQGWDLGVVGCRLHARRGSTVILPRNGAFPGAFANLLGSSGAGLRVAPVVIARGEATSGSDVLIVMAGNGASGDVSRPVRSPGALAANALRLDNVIGFGASDLALLSQPGIGDCVIQQLAAPTGMPDSVTLGGPYAHTAAPFPLLRGTGEAFLTPLGNPIAGNVQFQAFAVGDNGTLFSYDLLRTLGNGSDAAALQAIADGVVALRALYGVDLDGDGVFDQWMAPDATGWDAASMMADPARSRQVVAVRIALVLRGAHFERAATGAGGAPVYPSPAALTLFEDLSPAEQLTLTLTTNERHYRHRIVDTVVPLRNVLLLPTS